VETDDLGVSVFDGRPPFENSSLAAISRRMTPAFRSARKRISQASRSASVFWALCYDCSAKARGMILDDDTGGFRRVARLETGGFARKSDADRFRCVADPTRRH
jgi:hypothetical protein